MFLKQIKEIYSNKSIVLSLAKQDFKSKYIQNYFGILWAFIHPTVLILIFWFVFQVGFKSVAIGNTPFILWLVAAIVPWFFIADCLQSGTYSVVENAFLVKKIVFKTSLLPIVKISSLLIIHLFLIGIVLALYIIYGYEPNIYWIQTLYYLFCSIFLLIGISWITSSIVIFFRDLGQIISMVIQFGFWLTPIFWSIDKVPEKYHSIIKLNPFYYIAEGYRDSLIYHVWFWQRWQLSLYFWCVSIVFMVLGVLVFKKLKPHFADVL